LGSIVLLAVQIDLGVAFLSDRCAERVGSLSLAGEISAGFASLDATAALLSCSAPTPADFTTGAGLESGVDWLSKKIDKAQASAVARRRSMQ
jgi:hypothetical protein